MLAAILYKLLKKMLNYSVEKIVTLKSDAFIEELFKVLGNIL